MCKMIDEYVYLCEKAKNNSFKQCRLSKEDYAKVKILGIAQKFQNIYAQISQEIITFYKFDFIHDDEQIFSIPVKKINSLVASDVKKSLKKLGGIN